MVSWVRAPKPDLRGGFLPQAMRATLRFSPGHRRLRILQRQKKVRQLGDNSGGQPTLRGAPDGSDSALITWNIGGWRARRADLELLLSDQKPALVLIQEARIASEHRIQLQQLASKCGYVPHFAACTPWSINRRRQHRLDHGAVPGVVALSRQGTLVSQLPLKTAAAQEAFDRGRLQGLSHHCRPRRIF